MVNTRSISLHSVSDKNIGPHLPEDRASLRWWMTRYLATHATGAPATLKAKGEDLKTFLEWFSWAFGGDQVDHWNRAATNGFLQGLQTAQDPA